MKSQNRDVVMEERAVRIAKFIVKTKCTIREAAKKFSVSKSTVFKDVTERIEKTHYQLYNQVKEVLRCNNNERHIRGGNATKRKYEILKNKFE